MMNEQEKLSSQGNFKSLAKITKHSQKLVGITWLSNLILLTVHSRLGAKTSVVFSRSVINYKAIDVNVEVTQDSEAVDKNSLCIARNTHAHYLYPNTHMYSFSLL